MDDERAFQLKDIALNRIKLRPFVIFNQVLQTGSMLHAANQLHLTQPAVTKAIQELEAQLQVKLFIRKKHGVEPTPEGRLLADRSRHLLTQLRYLVDDINSFRGGGTGHIVVGTLLSGSVRLLPEAIIELKKKYPNVVVTVKVGTIEELFPALLKGDLDMVVGRIPHAQSKIIRQYELTHTALFRERVNLAVSKNHPLLMVKDMQLEDMLNYPWLLPLPGSEMRQAIADFFQQKQIPFPHNIIESMSLLTTIIILMQSEAICCMSDHVIEYLSQNNMVAVLPVGDIGQVVEVGYSVRPNEALSMACQNLIQIMHRLFDNLNPSSEDQLSSLNFT